MNKYDALHRKLVEGLVAANHQEYIGAHGLTSKWSDQNIFIPYLHTMVKMLASTVVKIVMDWEKETSDIILHKAILKSIDDVTQIKEI